MSLRVFVRTRDELDDEQWEAACRADFENLLREAVYVLSGLGRQTGPLGEAAGSLAAGASDDAPF